MTDEINPNGDLDPAAQADVENLENDIAATRDEMTDTVQTIGERLDPANIVQDAKDTVREATVGKVEQMTSSAMDTATDAGSGIIETMRRNPIPTAMAAIGIGWLLMNRSDGRGSYRSGASWDDSWRDSERYGYAGYPSSGRDRGMTERAGETIDQVGRKAGQVADDVRSTVGSTVGQLPDQVGSTAREVGWNAERVVQENPLALGAAAFAVGAAIGMALPETDVERSMLGGPAGSAIDKVQEAASDAVEQLQTSNA
ncbi:MAG TPA: DUF3618 domain-containing protein [Candidatus Limnocylindrales bacterium]|nr:DUF3618 domain-containing protein [Candidatus Limnocylindrales bacterium]